MTITTKEFLARAAGALIAAGLFATGASAQGTHTTKKGVTHAKAPQDLQLAGQQN